MAGKIPGFVTQDVPVWLTILLRTRGQSTSRFPILRRLRDEARIEGTAGPILTTNNTAKRDGSVQYSGDKNGNTPVCR